ncbi:MAG: hypothetical protein ACRDH9_13025 [Actinomycetota bacterium]
MNSFRIFAGATAGVSALILVLTQVLGGPEETAAPELEPIPLPTVAPSPTVAPTTAQPSPTPTEQPTLEEVGTVVYEHDFSSPAGGLLSGQSFETASNEFGTRLAEYTPAETLLVTSTSALDTYVAGANTQDLVVGGRDLSDLGEVSIEADATPDDIGESASWGLACRRDREVGRFYYAFVFDLGTETGAGIIRQDEPGGEWTELGFEELPDGVDVGRGTTNRLRLDCLGSTLTLFVDGQEAVRATDSTYPSGSVALFVNPIPSNGEASAEVAFDNLVIREAE